jgi:hypothetical protein
LNIISDTQHEKMNGPAYLATAVKYERKMFLKLTPGLPKPSVKRVASAQPLVLIHLPTQETLTSLAPTIWCQSHKTGFPRHLK